MLERFINIFEGSNDFYGQAKRIDNRLSVKVEVEAWTKKEPVSKQLWKNHLEGVGPQLGIAPLRKDGTCKWGAIDIDKNNYDYKELLNKIREKNFPLIMFRSKSGRAHVYMFMKDFYSAEEVKLVMNKFAAKLGIADILDRVYPMQINLESNMFGSWLNMPYFNHEEGSTFAYTDDFEDADVETFFEMYDKYAQDNLTDFLVEEVKEVVKPKKAKEKTIEDFFLPCVKNCLKDNNGKVPSVNRNDFLLHKYVWSMRAVKAGLKNIEKFSTYNAKNLLKFFNKNYLQDPLEEKEIDNTILKSTDREYNYLCKRPDIKKYCDASACTRHVCGITPQEALDLVEATQGLGNITEYTSVPPIFYETVEVTQADKVKKFIRVEMTGDVLINKKLWINALTSMGNFPPIAIVKLKDAAFLDMQYERLEKRVKEKADEEASEEYEFKALVYDFIRKQTVSFLKEDLLENACYVDKKTSLLDFKLDNFMNYLKTQKINTPRRKITFKLKHFLQAEKINGTVINKITNKKKSIPTWRFKSDPDKYEVLGDDAKPVIDYEKIRIAGPPGTGKTTKLVEIYYNHLEEYSPTQIMIISHTNTAADHIRNKITDIETIQKYEDETGRKLLQVIKNSKETLKENVSTIHKFCKDRLEKGLAFNMDDYENLKIQKPKFNKHTLDKQFYNVSLLVTSHPFFKFISMARDNGKDILPYYRSLTEEEKADYQYLPEELVEMSKQYKDFKTNKKINGREGRLLDFQDMVEEFCDNEEMSVASCKNIKVLIVDEAQDSSVIQRKAEEIMSRNVDYFYKAGDPDQSIFEFAGANPDSFHREFANPEIELKEGYRCPRVINEYCKKIISPIWAHYGYERAWKPREELDENGNRTGVVVEGEMYYLSDLAQDPFASELRNRILNTKESFIFTFRGGDPTQIINYLIGIGMPMKIAKEDQKTKFKYPAQMIKNQRAYIDFVSGKEVTIPQLKKFIKAMKDDYVLKTEEDLDKQVEKGTYNIDWFIDNKYALPGIKNTNDFQILIKDYPHKNIETKNYVREIVNKNRDLEDHRVFVENIHTIKGKEFDNVVFDFRLTRDEEMFTKKRLKFVACSRAKKTLWILKSKSALSFTGKEDL